MKLSFIKMHGLGNDFVVIDSLDSPVDLVPDQVRRLADRRRGIGCDQVLLVGTAELPGADVHCRIFNADGSEVEQCGNGVRCVGEYLRRSRGMDRQPLRVGSAGGVVSAYFPEPGGVRVDMGIPSFEPADIPLAAGRRQTAYRLSGADGDIEFMAVSMGNPHAVILVEDVDRAPVGELAPRIQADAMFPRGVNVGFMQVLDAAHIRLRVYERGVGETQACGTGACAAVAAGIITGRLTGNVDVELRGGALEISWEGEGQPLWMTGPAVTVYGGQIEI